MNVFREKVNILLFVLAFIVFFAFFTIIAFPSIFSLSKFSLFVDITIAIFGGIATYSIGISQRGQKKIRLEYHVNANAPVLTTSKTENDKVGILFDDKRGFYLVTLKVRNSGNRSIIPKDFDKQLTLDFGEKAYILKVDVLEKNPNGLNLNYTIEDHKLLIDPVLLNGKDTITMAVLLRGNVNKVSVEGKIENTEQEIIER